MFLSRALQLLDDALGPDEDIAGNKEESPGAVVQTQEEAPGAVVQTQGSRGTNESVPAPAAEQDFTPTAAAPGGLPGTLQGASSSREVRLPSDEAPLARQRTDSMRSEASRCDSNGEGSAASPSSRQEAVRRVIEEAEKRASAERQRRNAEAEARAKAVAQAIQEAEAHAKEKATERARRQAKARELVSQAEERARNNGSSSNWGQLHSTVSEPTLAHPAAGSTAQKAKARSLSERNPPVEGADLEAGEAPSETVASNGNANAAAKDPETSLSAEPEAAPRRGGAHASPQAASERARRHTLSERDPLNLFGEAGSSTSASPASASGRRRAEYSPRRAEDRRPNAASPLNGQRLPTSSKEAAWAEVKAMAQALAAGETTAALVVPPSPAGSSGSSESMPRPASSVNNGSGAKAFSRSGEDVLGAVNALLDSTIRDGTGRPTSLPSGASATNGFSPLPLSSAADAVAAASAAATAGHLEANSAATNFLHSPSPRPRSPGRPHVFERQRAAQRRGGGGGGASSAEGPCEACLGLWDAGGASTGRLYRCTACGALAHAACRAFLQVCLPCRGTQSVFNEVPNGVAAAAAATTPSAAAASAALAAAVAEASAEASRRNRVGTIQVIVHQAYELNLPAGESVYVCLRLLPWKEKVKTPAARWGDMGALWTAAGTVSAVTGGSAAGNAQPSTTAVPPTTAAASAAAVGGSNAGESVLSLVHPYNSQSTPVPVLRVELWRSAMSILDDMLCCAEITAAPLLLHPRAWAERWHDMWPPNTVFAANAPGATPRNSAALVIKDAGESAPRRRGMLLLSLRFQPTRVAGVHESIGSGSGAVLASSGGSKAAEDSVLAGSYHGDDVSVGTYCVESSVSAHDSGSGDLLARERHDSSASVQGEVAQRPAPAETDPFLAAQAANGASRTNEATERRLGQREASQGQDDDGSVGSAAAPPAMEEEKTVSAHLFRLTSYATPHWCGVCKGVLLGFVGQGFRCEACGMDVHKRCQAKANIATGCPGAANNDIGANGVAAGELASSVPLLAAAGAASSGNWSGAITPAPNAAGGPTLLANAADGKSRPRLDFGVGVLQVRVESAHRCGPKCRGGFHERGSGGGGDEGDHYCRVKFTDPAASAAGAGVSGNQVARTQTVFQTSNPVFNASWTFAAPGYDSAVALEVVDASTEKTLGFWESNMLSLLQRDHDARVTGQMPPGQRVQDLPLLPAGAVDSAAAAAAAASSAGGSGSGGSSGGDAGIAGLLRARVCFQEDTEGLFWGPNPRSVPPRAPDNLSVEALKRYVERAQNILGWVTAAAEAYRHVMAWEDPALTSILLLAFLYMTAVADAEYVLAVPPGCVLVCMGAAWLRRRSGRFTQDWIEHNGHKTAQKPSVTAETVHRPLAQLRAAVVRGRGLVSADLGLPGNAFVRVSLVPDPIAAAGSGGSGGGGGAAPAEALIGETPPHETTASPDWSKSGARGIGGGRSDGLGLYKGSGGESLIQNMTEIWPAAKHVVDGSEAAAASNGTAKEAALPASEPDDEDLAFVYPILQPINAPKADSDQKPELLPWEASRAYVRFAVFFANPFQSLMDSFQGHIVVPIADLLTNDKSERVSSGSSSAGPQKDVAKWYRITQPDANGAQQQQQQPASAPNSSSNRPGNAQKSVNGTPGNTNNGELFLRLQLTLPDVSRPPTPAEIDASAAVERMIYGASAGSGGAEKSSAAGAAAAGAAVATAAAVTAAAAAATPDEPSADGTQKGQDLSKSEGALDSRAAVAAAVAAAGATAATSGGGSGGGSGSTAGSGGSSSSSGGGGAMSTILNLRSTVKDLQGTLGTVLDRLEAAKNLLNWSHPEKTAVAFVAIAVVWFVLLMVPGRYLVMVGGLYSFSAKWISPAPKAKRGAQKQNKPPQQPSAISTRLSNLLLSLPTDEDLRSCYRADALAFSRDAETRARLKEQRAKLRALGAALEWDGPVRGRQRTGEAWSDKYLVVQGKRIAWWASQADLEKGRAAEGQLLLHGHAGVTSPSPLELREVSEPPRLVCIFGTGPEGRPRRWTFLARNVEEGSALAAIVNAAVEAKAD